jgi:hypothetical protein
VGMASRAVATSKARGDDTGSGAFVGNLVREMQGDLRRPIPEPTIHPLLC